MGSGRRDWEQFPWPKGDSLPPLQFGQVNCWEVFPMENTRGKWPGCSWEPVRERVHGRNCRCDHSALYLCDLGLVTLNEGRACKLKKGNKGKVSGRQVRMGCPKILMNDDRLCRPRA